ncbi:MAG: hypothetical protein P1P84_03970 [Deferrisomatales bacterium]|nr:hypothetical protein [Deferrisomatales bacterium]
MEKRDEPIIKTLMKTNEVFRREQETHQRYERLLEEFNRRSHLTTDEELERKKVQKLKLAGKDRMARLIFEYRRDHPTADEGTPDAQ